MNNRRSSNHGRTGDVPGKDGGSPGSQTHYVGLLMVLFVLGLFAVTIFLTNNLITGFAVLLNESIQSNNTTQPITENLTADLLANITLNATQNTTTDTGINGTLPEEPNGTAEGTQSDIPLLVEPVIPEGPGIWPDSLVYSQYSIAVIRGKELTPSSPYELHIMDQEGYPEPGYPVLLETDALGGLMHAWNIWNASLGHYSIIAASTQTTDAPYAVNVTVNQTAEAPPENATRYLLMNTSYIPVTDVKDSRGRNISHTAEAFQHTDNPSRSTAILQTSQGPVKRMRIKNIPKDQELRLGYEKLPTKGTRWNQYYAIDLSAVNFTEAEITAVAAGNELYKCKDWNFTEQTCHGEWEYVMDIVPGREYTFIMTEGDPGFGEVMTNTYYLLNTTDSQFPTYKQMLNQTPGSTSVQSIPIDLGTNAVFCWPTKWISNNWTNRTLVNGTWQYTVRAYCEISTAQAFLFGRIYKVNSTGEYNFQNSTQTATTICGGAPTVNTIIYSLPYTGQADLQVGERVATSLCINITSGKNKKNAYVYWGGATPSNVKIPTTFWDEDPPIIWQKYLLDGRSTELPNITLVYEVFDANTINACTLNINSTLNQTDTTVTRDVDQYFSLYNLPLAEYNWSVNCTDSRANHRLSPEYTFYVIDKTPPVINLTSPPNNSVFYQGDDIYFNATVFDYEDGYLSGSSIRWESSQDGLLGFGNLLRLATLSPGNHTITVTAIDSFQLTSSESVNITITSALCSGQEGGKFTLVNITVDGDMTDWEPVLQDPDNIILDGVAGVSDPDIIQTADKDLRKFAVTWNEEWLWMYIRRSAGGANVIGIDTYFDLALDNLLQSTDKVLIASWSGSNRRYDTTLYNYAPVNASGDPITGDGVDEPGTINTPVSLESNVLGGSDEGIELEYRVRWSDLGAPACSPVIAHISSALGSGTNIPSQLEDNMAKFDSRVYAIKFYPDSILGGKAGTTVTHMHTLRNTGNLQDLFNINVTGTLPGYNVTLFYPNGTLLQDTDGDGRVDSGYLNPNYGIAVYVNISIPGSATNGDVDTTVLTAISKQNSSINKSVTDTTIVGIIVIIPHNEGLAVNGSVVQYVHYIYNNDYTTFVNVNASSSLGYPVTLHYANGTQLTDTNWDSLPDVGQVITGIPTQVLVRIYTASTATIGTVDNTTVTANSTAGEHSSAYDKTTISQRITIYPNITTSGGKGSAVFLIHNVSYVSNSSDVVDITYNQTQPYAIYLLEDDYFTLLTDTNNNSIIDLGTFSTNGDTKTIIVKLYVDETAQINDTDLIYYNVTPSYDGGLATAMDNVSAQQLVTFLDSGRIQQSYYFKQTQTVYARGFALYMANVYFSYVDPNASVKRISPYIPVDELNTADDQMYINNTYLSGEWTLILRNKQGDAEITRIHFYVNVPPIIISINDTPDPVYQGQRVNFTANITAGELNWLPNESVVMGAYLQFNGVNYSMVRPNISSGIGLYYFDTLNTSNVSPGLYQYKIFAYDNLTYFNISIPKTGTIEVRAVNFTNVSGVVTDSRYNVVPCTIYIYNSTGDIIITEDEYYNFTLYRSVPYNITIVPDNGSLKKVTYADVLFPPFLFNFTRLEDTRENDTDMPDEIYNWTESIAWWINSTVYYSDTVINFTYGNDTGLYFWKCNDWNFDNRSCNNNNFFITQNLSDGPGWAEVHVTPGDPGAGAGRAPDYTESLKVWDVTGLNETGRRYNGTLVGEFYDLEDVNLTINKAYRFEIFVTQTVERTRGILRDPYYDNIQDGYVIDLSGIDAPNITEVNGSVNIDPITPTVVSGSEAGTQKLIWDSAPPNKTVSDIDVNETVKLWFVIDVLANATNESHLGHFVGKSKGQDAELTNNITTIIGTPPYPPNLTYPNNGNNTLINRTLTFIWQPAYDPDNQTLTYQINITSELCSDIFDTNISATNYTSIYELGTYDECGSYNWTVRAYDGYYYGNWSESWNFSIQPYVALYFINDTVDFGEAELDEYNDTTDDLPPPFLIRSDGNVFTDVVNVTANQSFFVGQSAEDSDFQLRADNATSEPGAFNWTGSAIYWINLTTQQTILDYLDWHDVNDSAEIEVKVHVPVDEPPGLKITGLVFYGAQS